MIEWSHHGHIPAPSARHLNAQIPSSKEQVTCGGHVPPCPCPDQFLDPWEGTYTRPCSSIKTPDPKQTRLSLLSFLSLPDALCVCSLSIPSRNSALASCWLMFDSYPVYSQWPSWLVLPDPLWVLGPSLPTSAMVKPELKPGYLCFGCFG